MQTPEQHKTVDDARLDDVVSIANLVLLLTTVELDSRSSLWWQFSNTVC